MILSDGLPFTGASPCGFPLYGDDLVSDPDVVEADGNKPRQIANVQLEDVLSELAKL